MMLNEAIEMALCGQAILFTGAGFSIGAENLRHTSFKTGKQLANHLSKSAGFDEDIALDIAAEEYINVHGKDKLIDELHNEFTVRTFASYHVDVAKIPWKRIYTTNYDNVMERAYAEFGKKLLPVTLSDKIRNLPKENTLCVHLNGYIDKLDRESLMSEFKLTDTSYSTSSIAESDWATLFRDDVKAARAVFFIGYSLADLDIKRILIENENLASKSFFILGKTPSKLTTNVCSKFGQILSINTLDFAHEVEKIASTYTVPEALEFWSSNIEKYLVTEKSKNFSDEYIFDLFLRGDYKPPFIIDSLLGGAHYFLNRPQTVEIIEQIKYQPSVIVIHSDLGNGKTLLVEGLKFAATQSGFDVYSLVEKNENILEDINNLLNLKGSKKVIFVENYPDWFNEINYIANNANDTCSLILTARTSTHDALVDRLGEIFDSSMIMEFSIDKLSDDGLLWVENTFTEYGLWGDKTSFSKKSKQQFLSGQCNAEFHAILLELLKSPTIISRLEQIFDSIKNKREYHKVIISVLILNVLNIPATIDRLVDYWGSQVLDSRIRQDPAIQQIVDFKQGRLSLRSSVAAKHILQNATTIDAIIDTMISMMRTSERLSSSSKFHFDARKQLSRFNTIQEILPEGGKRPEIIRYFENIRNLPSLKTLPVFWLQYAIACLVLEDFERADKYFENAFALADSRDNYDLFQIENQYARFLLIRTVKQKMDISKAMIDFHEAHRIIHSQAGSQRLYFPYRVAEWYINFYDIYSMDLRPKDRTELERSASEIISRIHQLPRDRQSEKHVRRCESNLQELLEKMAGI